MQLNAVHDTIVMPRIYSVVKSKEKNQSNIARCRKSEFSFKTYFVHDNKIKYFSCPWSYNAAISADRDFWAVPWTVIISICIYISEEYRYYGDLFTHDYEKNLQVYSNVYLYHLYSLCFHRIHSSDTKPIMI